jgi:hypothetical protein
MDRPMWTCPDCGRQFHNINNSHSCMARIGVQEHRARCAPASCSRGVSTIRA